MDDLQSLAALLSSFGGSLDDTTVFAVNDGGVLYQGRLHHWCTLHGEDLAGRIQRRLAAGFSDGFVTWDYDGIGTDRQLAPQHRITGCTSAFVAVAVAYHLEHRRIVLCGAPIDRRGYYLPHIHHGEGVWEHSQRNQEWIRRYTQRLQWLRSCVRSMSGWTADFFGMPTAEWLLENDWTNEHVHPSAQHDATHPTI